jgi:hypothetical protein
MVGNISWRTLGQLDYDIRMKQTAMVKRTSENKAEGGLT